MNNKNDEFEKENLASVEVEENKNFLTLAPENSIKALQKVEAISKTIDGATRLALQRTHAQDWVKMGEKYYLQASGVEKIRGVFGLYFRDRKIIREDFPDGGYAYICTGLAGSKFLDGLYGETTIEIEGSRSAKDTFFTGNNREPDPMDVRKAAYANFQVRAAKALLGLGNYTEKDLVQMGVNISKVAKVDYQKGAEGGGKTNLISEAQRKRLFALCKENNVSDSDVKAYLKEKFKIDSTSKIKRSDYEEICNWAQSEKTFDADREPGSEG